RNPLGVRLREVFYRCALVAGGLLVCNAELVPRKTGTIGRGRHQDVALELQAGGRSAVEEMPVYLQFYRKISLDLLFPGRKLKFESFRDVVLDHEGGLADRRALRIGEGTRPPCARRDRRIERHRQ